MRRNWDFVTMSDYKSDMDEISKRSADIISLMKDDLDRAERMLQRQMRAVLSACGGRLEISDRDLWNMDRGGAIKVVRDDPNQKTIITLED